MALLGILIGLGLIFALPFWLGFAGHSWWWLLLAAAAMGIIGYKPITIYNNVLTARHHGRWGSVIWLILGPFAMMGGFMVIPFLIGRWIG